MRQPFNPAQVLDIRTVSKSFGAKSVLDSISLTLNRGDRLALVGENGVGKSTLAQIIIGDLLPDSGEVRLAADVAIGYLPQAAPVTAATTVQMLIDSTASAREQVSAELTWLETALATPNLQPAALQILLADYAQQQDAFIRLGGYDDDHQIDQVFAGLDIGHIDRSRQVQSLSGGEQTRVMLAGLLLRAPELLILDEPTNHLDFAALDWLEAYLIGYSGALLVISHDRHFLNTVITRIAELSPGTHQLTHYVGNYDFYLAERARLWARQRQAFETQEAERDSLEHLIKTRTHNPGKTRPPADNDNYIPSFRQAQTEKSSGRVIANVRQRLAVLDRDALSRPDDRRWQINPDFAPDTLVSRDVIRLSHLSKSIDGRPILCDVSAVIRGGEHVVLYGPNGIGKTTLIRLIVGSDLPDAGSVTLAGSARIGYLDQAIETLDPRWTVLDAFSHDLSGDESERRASLHKYGLFSGDEVQQPVGSLSWGQKRKLQLARLIAQQSNVLLLDEPTNHLDLASVEQFDQALAAFSGTVLAISHDRVFIERIAHQRWTLHDGKLLIDS